jgi:hypothetical protein
LKGGKLVKIVDELYHLLGTEAQLNEEELDMLTFAVLDVYNRKDLLRLVGEMTDEELHYFIRLYLVESLKGKFTNKKKGAASQLHLH